MKKIKEGLVNEEIIRRYSSSNNDGGNYVIDKGKRGGPRSHDYGNVVAEKLGDLDANMSGGGGCYGNQAKFCEGQDKVTFANKGGRNCDEEEW